MRYEHWTVDKQKASNGQDDRALIMHPSGLTVKWSSNLGGPSVYVRSQCCKSGVQSFNGVMECRKCREPTPLRPRISRWTHLDHPSEVVAGWVQCYFPVFESIIVTAELEDIFEELEKQRWDEIRRKHKL